MARLRSSGASARQARKRSRSKVPPEIRMLRRLLRRGRSITITMPPRLWISLKVALQVRLEHMRCLGIQIDPADEYEQRIATALARIEKALAWPPPSDTSPPAGEVGAAPAAPGEGDA